MISDPGTFQLFVVFNRKMLFNYVKQEDATYREDRVIVRCVVVYCSSIKNFIKAVVCPE